MLSKKNTIKNTKNCIGRLYSHFFEARIRQNDQKSAKIDIFIKMIITARPYSRKIIFLPRSYTLNLLLLSMKNTVKKAKNAIVKS